jgi:hypothetical protein
VGRCSAWSVVAAKKSVDADNTAANRCKVDIEVLFIWLSPNWIATLQRNGFSEQAEDSL